MGKPTLFLSFTSLLRLVKEGRVSQKELDTGLFYFGCTRNHVFNPDDHSTAVVIAKLDEEKKAQEKVQAAVFMAELQSRVAFRRSDLPTSYAQLYDLLEKNNLDLSLFVNGNIPKGVAEVMDIENICIDDIKDATTLQDIVAIIDRTRFFQFSHELVAMIFGHIANVRM